MVSGHFSARILSSSDFWPLEASLIKAKTSSRLWRRLNLKIYLHYRKARRGLEWHWPSTRSLYTMSRIAFRNWSDWGLGYVRTPRFILPMRDRSTVGSLCAVDSLTSFYVLDASPGTLDMVSSVNSIWDFCGWAERMCQSLLLVTFLVGWIFPADWWTTATKLGPHLIFLHNHLTRHSAHE